LADAIVVYPPFRYRFFWRPRETEGDLTLLIDAGILGLMDAICRFDPERGITFTTFSLSRISGAILDVVREGHD